MRVQREFCEILTNIEELSALFIESRLQTIFPAMLCIPSMTCINFLEAPIEIQSNITDSEIETSSDNRINNNNLIKSSQQFESVMKLTVWDWKCKFID